MRIMAKKPAHELPPKHGGAWVSLAGIEPPLTTMGVGEILGSEVSVQIAGREVTATVKQVDPAHDQALVEW